MKEKNGNLHMKVAEEFRAQLSLIWEFAQKEMNENRNENFYLSREVQKLANKRSVLEMETNAGLR